MKTQFARHEILLATSNALFNHSFQRESSLHDFILDTVDSPRDFNQLSKKKVSPEIVILDLNTMGKNLSLVIYHLNQFKTGLPTFVVCNLADPALLDKANKNLSVVLSLPSPTTKQGFRKLFGHVYDFFNEDLKKKLIKVEYLKNENVFACTFANKEIFFIERREIPEEHPASAVEGCKIGLDQYHFSIHYSKGEPTVIPWDFIRHLADQNDEFYKGKDQKKGRLTAEEIGQRILRARGRKEITQDQLASQTGILRNNISRIENGHHSPSLPLLEKIAQALDIPVVDLLS